MAIVKPVYDKKKLLKGSAGTTTKPALRAPKTGVVQSTATTNSTRTTPRLQSISQSALSIRNNAVAKAGNLGTVFKKTTNSKTLKNKVTKAAKNNKSTKATKGNKKTTNKGYNLTQKTKNAVKTVNQRFKNYLNQYKKTVNTQVKNDTNASNAQYNANAQQAALRDAVQRRELQKQMYRNGITGGATETVMMNQANNYANQQGKIASDRVASANTIRQKANADIAAFTLQNMQNKAAALDSAKDRVYNKYLNWQKRQDDLRKERKADKRYNAETKYNHKQDNYNKKQTKKAERNTTYQLQVSGYNSVKTINNLIKKAKKQGKTWKIPYLVARRGEIVRENKNK